MTYIKLTKIGDMMYEGLMRIKDKYPLPTFVNIDYARLPSGVKGSIEFIVDTRNPYTPQVQNAILRDAKQRIIKEWSGSEAAQFNKAYTYFAKREDA